MDFEDKSRPGRSSAEDNKQSLSIEMPLCVAEIGNMAPFILVEIADQQYLRMGSQSHLEEFHKLGEELEKHGKPTKDWKTLETGWLDSTAEGVRIISGSGTIDPPEYQNVEKTKLFISKHLKDVQIVDS